MEVEIGRRTINPRRFIKRFSALEFQEFYTVGEKCVKEKHPDFSDVHYSLGTDYGKQGNMADAHFHLGAYYSQKGKLKSAAYHLERARDMATDPKRQEAIEKMLEGVNKRMAKAARQSQ